MIYRVNGARKPSLHRGIGSNNGLCMVAWKRATP